MPSDSILPDAASKWFYAEGEESHGPLPFAEVQQLLASGAISPETLVSPDGPGSWKHLSDVFPCDEFVAPPQHEPAETAEPGSAAQTTPPPPSTGATIGGCCVLVGLVALVVWCGVSLKSCIFEGSHTSAKVSSTSKLSTAYKIACIDAGTRLPQGDSSIHEYDSLLNSVGKSMHMDHVRIADMTVAASSNLKEHGKDISVRELLHHMVTLIEQDAHRELHVSHDEKGYASLLALFSVYVENP